MLLPKNHEFTEKIEACLNSRPLTELSSDPSDFNTLTPAHFLVRGPIHQFKEPSQPSRSKWWRTKPNLQIGEMVIVKKERAAPLNWTLGRINKLFVGPDQKVRVVSVNTKYGQLTRNVNKIYLLPNSQEI
ncbi:integrase catalytic domain-containing protein [Trichonephila inaurata madagascariensis]|uniref:Integrase catalytic domain-containing protein n=1 Tax=Trichonephila inaurata madagascariensis TaxID=2747483 RepID=A0A8X6XDM9_9ARAC|nr:integrase catalytic domain-containing protein [Trichonephila inaurata madagascariensis]